MDSLSRRRFCTVGTGALLSSYAHPFYGRAQAKSAKATGHFTNPILPGDHPDPSSIRVGDDYYLTHSSFLYTPGLVVWHSRNLVDWTPVSAALHRFIGDVWAPYLCQHGDRFYIYVPIDGKFFVVHAESPRGPWSEPIDLGIRGIDPAHLGTPYGRRFLYTAGGQMIELAADGLSVKGSFKKVFQAWPIPEAWRVECECLEAPKVLQKDGYYYLNVAEGGTSGPPTSHMVISMRSRNPEGPWEYSPHNPIMHTTSKDSRWWSVGHGRLVEAVDGSWWMTCHAYENGYRTLGRQNLLVPVEWTKDGWYRVPADITQNAPIAIGSEVRQQPMKLSDDFSGRELGLQWQFFKGYDASRVSLQKSALTLKAHGGSWADTSVMSCIAGDHSYTVEVDVSVEQGCEAGLLLFYNSEHSVGLSLGPKGLAYIRNGQFGKPGIPDTNAEQATLRLVNDEQQVDIYYRLAGQPWGHVRNAVDVTGYNQNVLKGFLDVRPALYAAGSSSATFRAFRYAVGAHSPM